ncbi:hypothetical protein V1517DRAFT_333665 [Lipomyces orientalis]|uniref:Uncharacterized protein n=1 Tax=Lipomyces orientalis TaxID=1233043 RepID=A0ACC3TDP8_9ASCO
MFRSYDVAVANGGMGDSTRPSLAKLREVLEVVIQKTVEVGAILNVHPFHAQWSTSYRCPALAN